MAVDLNTMVQRLIDNGESEQNIKKVIEKMTNEAKIKASSDTTQDTNIYKVDPDSGLPTSAIKPIVITEKSTDIKPKTKFKDRIERGIIGRFAASIAPKSQFGIKSKEEQLKAEQEEKNRKSTSEWIEQKQNFEKEIRKVFENPHLLENMLGEEETLQNLAIGKYGQPEYDPAKEFKKYFRKKIGGFGLFGGDRNITDYPDLLDKDVNNIVDNYFDTQLYQEKTNKANKRKNQQINYIKNNNLDMSNYMSDIRKQDISTYTGVKQDIAKTVELINHGNLTDFLKEEKIKELSKLKEKDKSTATLLNLNTGMLIHTVNDKDREEKLKQSNVTQLDVKGTQQQYSTITDLDKLETLYEESALKLNGLNNELDQVVNWTEPGTWQTDYTPTTGSASIKTLMKSRTKKPDKFTEKEWKQFQERIEDDLIEYNTNHEAIKGMYLLNEGILATKKQPLKQSVKSFVEPFIGKSATENFIGFTGYDIGDKKLETYNLLGFPVSDEEKKFTTRSTLEQINEGLFGSGKMLLSFYGIGKFLKPIEAVSGFTAYMNHLNSARYVKNGRTFTSKTIQNRSKALGITPKKYAETYGLKNIGPGLQNKLIATNLTGIKEGLKFATIEAEMTGEPTGFATGYGFGASGRIFAPLMPLAKADPQVKKLYEFFVKNPANFVVGSEFGEITNNLTAAAFGKKDFSDFMKEHYSDFNTFGQRMIVNHSIGVGFSFGHFKGFGDFKNESQLFSTQRQARKNMDNLATEAGVTGKEIAESGFWSQRVQSKIQDNLSEKSFKNYYKNLEVYNNMYTRLSNLQEARGYLSGKNIERDMQGVVAENKKFGIETKIEIVDPQKLKEGQKPIENDAAAEVVIDGKKTIYRFNPKKYTPGIEVHEIGHEHVFRNFSKNTRFKGEFIETLNNIAGKIEIGERVVTEADIKEGGFDNARLGKRMTLQEALKLEKFDLDNPVNAQRIKEWEMFSYVAQYLSNKGNLNAIRETNGFKELRTFLSNVGKKAGHKYNLSTEGDVVRWFGDYINSVGKGYNSKKTQKLVNELEQVIDWELTAKQQAELRAKQTDKLSSRNLNKEKAKRVQENIDLLKNKPEGWREKAKENSKRIKELNKNIELSENNAENIRKYKEKEAEGKDPSMEFKKLQKDNAGILNDYINNTYKDVPGSTLTKAEFKNYVENNELLKLIKSHKPETNVPFGAYLKNNLKLRTGNILKDLGVDLDVSMKTTRIDETTKQIADKAKEAGVPSTEPGFSKGIELVFELPVKTLTIDQIRNSVPKLDLKTLDYKTLKDQASEATKEMFGKNNKEKAQFIADNWKTIYDTLPLGAQKTTGKATGIENSILKDFYKKSKERVRMAKTGDKAGLFIQEKIPMGKTEFLNKLGIKVLSDGKVDISGMGRNIKTSTIPAITNQVGKAITNQVVRQKLREDYNNNIEYVDNMNIETLQNQLRSGTSDKLFSLDLQRHYKNNGINKPLPEIVKDINRFAINPELLKKQNPNMFKTTKDLLEIASIEEAKIGKENEIKFSNFTKQLPYEFAKTGEWRLSTEKFKQNPKLVKKFMNTSFEIADIIPIPKGSFVGNGKMFFDMFTGHYNTIRTKGIGEKGKLDKVDSEFYTGLKTRLGSKKSFLPEEIQKEWRNFKWQDLINVYASKNKTGLKRMLKETTFDAQQKIAREVFSTKEGKQLIKFYNLWNSTLTHWVHQSPKNSLEFNRKMDHIARMKKNNSLIGTQGERVLAPIGWVYIPGKTTTGTIKYEHRKSSSQMSAESLALIANGSWMEVGMQKLQGYSGIYGMLRHFNSVDANTGKVNSSGIFRFAENMELAKNIYSVESNFTKSLYQEMIDVVGKKTIKEFGKRFKTFDKRNDKILQSTNLFSKDLNSSQKAKAVENIDKAVALGKLKNKETKGISVWDFDDTIAKSKSKVLFTTPDGKKGSLTPKQYADKYVQLAEQGYKFDFSEFNKVIDGKKGPLFGELVKRIKKFGVEDNFILTARPAESAAAIKEFLKSQGLDIPLENITGLANSTAEAKALWMTEKFAEGYNDFYFADDAIKNVKAVKNVLDQLDVKSKVQQALQSKDLNKDFNKIVEETTGIRASEVFSGAKAKMIGKSKWTKSIIVPGAQDFMGMMQNFAGKGKKGEAHIKFFEDNMVTPFAKGINDMNHVKQRATEDFQRLAKDLPTVKKKLNKKIPNSVFTYDQAIRVHIWDKAGFEIPDLSKKEIKDLNKVVRKDHELLNFSESLQQITKGNYAEPGQNWIAETILSDVQKLTQFIGRKKYLADWIENKNTIFSKENLNKIEVTQGSKFRESLEDMLYRMETGSNRPTGSNRLTNMHMNFINGSVGATMFLNMRSAILQTISATNYINFAENNPVKAAKAFGNQKQYWKDFSYIWNSPMLKQRRAGLQYNVQEAELAAAVAGSKNKGKAAMAWLIKKGFTPTQVADSFAISAGGASYYRNRIGMYEKLGYSFGESRKKAWLDFQETTEKAQQSSRADLISQQQASPLGRTILAWANTPMQYMRIQEKAARNIINGRGDFKENMSKIAYYGFAQSILFAGLQNAMFSFGLDKEEDLDDKDFNNRLERVINTVADGQLRGMGTPGALLSAVKNTALEFDKQNEKGYKGDHTKTILQLTGYSPVLGSKLRKLYSATQTYKSNKDVIPEMGLSLNNPANLAIGNAIEATTNVPIARAVMKIDNIREALDDRNQSWQRIALLMGWSKWDVGAETEEVKEIKEKIKKEKKEFKIQQKLIEKAKKAKEQEAINLEKQIKEKEEGKKVTCIAMSSSGQRCGLPVVGEGKYCTIHQKVEQGTKEVQCKKIKSDGKQCKMKTKNKSGLCYYHD